MNPEENLKMRSVRTIQWLTFLILSSILFQSAQAIPQATAVQVLPGMPPVIDPHNLYSESTAGKFSPAVAGALTRVYVPHVKSGDVYVIDPATFQVVDKFVAGGNPQHVIPSWDMKTLWVAGSAESHSGLVIPIDPKTAKPGP